MTRTTGFCTRLCKVLGARGKLDLGFSAQPMIEVTAFRPAFLLPNCIGTLPDGLLFGDLSVSRGDRSDDLRLSFSLLLAYYDPDGRLGYAGRAGTGIDHTELEHLWRRLQPSRTPEMPLDVPPPRAARFGSPLTLSRVHWVRPELVAEVRYLTWTEELVAPSRLRRCA